MCKVFVNENIQYSMLHTVHNQANLLNYKKKFHQYEASSNSLWNQTDDDSNFRMSQMIQI